MAIESRIGRWTLAGLAIAAVGCSSPSEPVGGQDTPPGPGSTTSPPGVAGQPTTTGTFASNEPGGLTAALDYTYSGSYSGGGTTNLNGTGIAHAAFSGLPNDFCAIVPAASTVAGGSPYGPQVWESHYSAGHSGTGPCNQTFNLGAKYDTVHVSVAMFWESGWEANRVSEKFLWWNTPSNGHLFQWTWTNATLYNVTSETGCNYLEVTAGTPLSGASAPCQNQQQWPLIDGRWTVLEFLIIQTDAENNGELHVWQDGTLIISQTGRSFEQVREVSLWDTWGGGGNLSREQSKLFGRWRIARSAN